MTRPKPFLSYFILCAIPLLLLAGLNYWNGIRTVDSTISTIVQNDLNAFNVAVEQELQERQSALLQLAMAPETRRMITQKEAELPSSLPNLGGQFQSLTLFGNDRSAVAPNLTQPDPSVWSLLGNVSVEKPGKAPATREYTAPVHDEKGTSNVGAVVGVLDLESAF